MRAAVMREIGAPLEIVDIEVDSPATREVLVEVAAAGLCHSDLHFIEGRYPLPVPAVLGHESAGVVLEVGRDVAHVSPGDHVITSLSVFCGTCRFCVTGRSHLCEDRAATQRADGSRSRLSLDGAPLHQFLDLGSFSEQVLVHENAVVRIPAAMPLDRAALLGCGAATGIGAVMNTAGVRQGESVAVIGCGGVGLSAVQGARLAGASPIIALDINGEKLGLAAQLGATDVLLADQDDVIGRVREACGGRGVDHAIEAVGSTRTTELAFSLLGPGGTATVIGLIPPGDAVMIPGAELYWEKKLQGSNMGSVELRSDLPRYVDWYLEGLLDLDSLITRRLQLDQVNEGFDEMRHGRGARTIVAFGGGG